VSASPRPRRRHGRPAWRRCVPRCLAPPDRQGPASTDTACNSPTALTSSCGRRPTLNEALAVAGSAHSGIRSKSRSWAWAICAGISSSQYGRQAVNDQEILVDRRPAGRFDRDTGETRNRPVGNRHRALIDSELESQNLVVAPAARTILSLTQLSSAYAGEVPLEPRGESSHQLGDVGVIVEGLRGN
jgi:hypothetical protein